MFSVKEYNYIIHLTLFATPPLKCYKDLSCLQGPDSTELLMRV